MSVQLRKWLSFASLHCGNSIFRKQVMAKKTKNASDRWPKGFKFNLLGGIFNLLFGALMFAGLFDILLDAALDFNFQIREGAMFYEIWKSLPIPMDTRFHVLEIRNPSAFINGQKPVLRSHGPFLYKQSKVRTQITFSDDEDKVSFMEGFSFRYSRKGSHESIDRKMKLINPVYIMTFFIGRTIMTKFHIKFLEPIVANAINMAYSLTDESLIADTTPREYLEGRNITLLAMLDSLTTPLKQLGIPIPDLKFGTMAMSGSKFGFILMRQATFGPFEMYTGHQTPEDFNTYASAFGKPHLTTFKAPCNFIHGSDGVAWRRKITRNRTIAVYNAQLCRAFVFQFRRETTFSGVKVFEYGLDDHSFDMRLRKNHCFCSKSDPSKCEGYTDLSPCFDGLPMALTFPHFYASGNLLRKVDGLQPGPDHVTKLLIEPNLGITMAAYVRMQINLVLEPFPVRGLRNLSPVVMPILWLEEGAVLKSVLLVSMVVGVYALIYGVYGFLLQALLGLAQMAWAVRLLVNYKKGPQKVSHQNSIEKPVVDWNQNSRPPIVTAEDRLRDSVKSRHSQMYQNMDSVYMDVNKLKSDIIRRSRRPEGEGPVYANE